MGRPTKDETTILSGMRPNESLLNFLVREHLPKVLKESWRTPSEPGGPALGGFLPAPTHTFKQERPQ